MKIARFYFVSKSLDLNSEILPAVVINDSDRILGWCENTAVLPAH
jgi:hypothetical protein